MTKIRFLSGTELVGLATPEEYISEIRDAYRQVGEGAPAEPRTQLYSQDRNGSLTSYVAILPDTGVMGGYMYSAGFGSSDAWFFTPIFDAAEGTPLALLDGSYMNPYKTGGVGALGTDTLARDDATILTIIGTGKQARGQLRAHVTIRDFEEIRVFSPTEANREDFVEWSSTELGRTVTPMESSSAAVSGADVVVTATTAEKPVVDYEDISPGTHISAIGQYTKGRRELDEKTIQQATYVPDLYERAFQDAGSFLYALKNGTVTKDHVRSDIGSVIAGTSTGRSSDDEVTIFDSGGTAVETLAAANLLYEKARAKDRGTEINLVPASDIEP